MHALLLVDLQNDFLLGGALAVPRGDEVIPLANRLMPHFDLVVATQDWHPADHGSFAANHPHRAPGEQIELAGLPQVLWPVHCVQGTPGAAFAPGLNTTRIAQVFRKGAAAALDSYSGFFDNAHRRATGLGEYLKRQSITSVYIAGLATDYCVKYTARDAKELGFDTHVIADACRGVDLQPGDWQRALDELTRDGVHVINLDEAITQAKQRAADRSAGRRNHESHKPHE